ncbi:MAG: LacI family DNA-binding transcriptional regulator [Chloroflexota bacterium]
MPPTIRDVAKRLNLSITTVSRALDGYDDVAEETRQRVIQTAREMGYVPTRAARQLRKKRTDMIGYIMPTSQPRFSDPFFSEFIAGLGDEALNQHFELLISVAPPDEEAEIKTYQNWVFGRRVDGLILSRMRQQDWRVDFLESTQFPFTAFGRTNSNHHHPYIGVDGKNGIRQLVHHLVEQGHQRIAFICAPQTLTLQKDRFEGYLAGLKDANLPLDTSLLAEGDLTRKGGYLAALQLLSLPQPPTAIIGVNDLTAIGALRAIHEKGLQAGKQIAIAGFDGIEDTEHTHPPLTTVRQPVYEIARQLIRLLVKLINGEEVEEGPILIQPELIIRNSTLRE